MRQSACASCPICRGEGPPRASPELVAVESRLWIVRHHAHPAPLAGWFQLISRRHVQGPAGFDAEEAADFGPALRDVSAAVERELGALRVYAIAFGEGAQHLHVHLVPRREDRPEVAAWNVADWYRAVERGERPAADPGEVLAVTAALRRRLSAETSDGMMRWRAPCDA